MEKTSLLAHIVHDYCSQAENIASDSLHFILENSRTAKEAFCSYLTNYGIDLSSSVDIHKQIQDIDRNQPDLSIHKSGEPVVYIEAKFGAPLTPKQPVRYWQKLSEKKDSLLLFIVPKGRMHNLWKELVGRLRDVEPDLVEQENRVVLSSHFPMKIMAITSWEELLETLLSALEIKGEKERISDIYQLKMLCQDKDILAMGLVKVEPKDGPYHRYVDSLIHWLESECKQFATKKGLTTGKGYDYYAQYIRIQGIICGILYHASWQLKYEDTLLWFWIDKTMIVREKLPPGEIHTENAGFIIPLWIRVEANYDENLNSLKKQILTIAQGIANGGS